MTSTHKSLAIAFVAGFISVIIFHQSMVAALVAASLAPPAFAPWGMEPIAPFGVPTLVSKAFWGGLWSMLLWLLLRRQQGAAYWLGWILLGATALPLVAIFVVPAIKGLPPPDFWTRFPIAASINAIWGLGTAVLLRLLRAAG